MKEKVTMIYKEDIERFNYTFNAAESNRYIEEFKAMKALGKRCGNNLAAPFFKHIQ